MSLRSPRFNHIKQHVLWILVVTVRNVYFEMRDVVGQNQEMSKPMPLGVVGAISLISAAIDDRHIEELP
jgi:hypothetical protein